MAMGLDGSDGRVLRMYFQEKKYPEITVKAELRAKKLCLWVQTCVIGFYQTDHVIFRNAFLSLQYLP